MRISNTTLSLLSASLFVVGLSAGLTTGCGSSSSNDYAGTCNKACSKQIACQPDGGSGLTIDQSFCTAICSQEANTTACPNAAALSAAFQACLAKTDCTEFNACMDAAPDCTTTGTGGSSGTHTGGTTGVGGHGTGGAGGHGTGGVGGHGTGGTPGTAGNGGTADCSVCTKANSCCMALAPLGGGTASDCTLSASDCSANADATTYASGCQQFLTAGSALGLAACK